MNTRHRRPLVGLALTLGLTGLVACGSDDDDQLSDAACDAVVDFHSAYAMAPQDPAEIAEYVSAEFVPLAATLEDELDGDERLAAEALTAAFSDVAESGDPGAMESPAAVEARTTIGQAVHDRCDLEAVDIGAVEYAFKDVPESLDAGRISFALGNTGVEDHEMVLFKRAPDATETLAEILELPEEEQMAKIQFTGVTFGGPDSTTYVALDLDPGTYFLLCFLPQGGGEDGPPHFMDGMQASIVVA